MSPGAQPGPARSDPTDLPVGELLKRASEQTSRLVREELRLAQLEMQQKAKHAGIGAGLLAGAAFVALFAAATLVAMLVLLLATALEPWLAALIVAAGLLAVAGILAIGGKGQLTRAAPPAPEQTIESVKADVEEVRAHART